jgi:CMP-N,N'-diacetyllegionaminic acid synthase
VIDGRSVLAVIPARGGSKGLPGKNILPVGGKPLLAWTIDAARAAACIDRLILSSDDEAIMAVARAHGCEVPFHRPAALATDEATSIDVVLHALDTLPGYDVVVLLQPTSPLRSAADIEATCAKLASSGVQACVSVSPVAHSPYWMYLLGDDLHLVPLVEPPAGVARRQDLPPAYTLNGAVYAAETAWLRRARSFVTRETVAHVMPAERAIDIDTQDDLSRLRAILEAASSISRIKVNP